MLVVFCLLDAGRSFFPIILSLSGCLLALPGYLLSFRFHKFKDLRKRRFTIKELLNSHMLAHSFSGLWLAVPAAVLVGFSAGAFSFRWSTTIHRTAVAKANSFSCAIFSISLVAQSGKRQAKALIITPRK